MARKGKVQKRIYYKIGEACKIVDIQPYVLRYWETEFASLSPDKSRSGQRVYSEKELEIIRRIKALLYDEGYTIAGAKKKLETELAAGGPEAASASPQAPSRRKRSEDPPPPALDTRAADQIQTLRDGVRQALEEARGILAQLGP